MVLRYEAHHSSGSTRPMRLLASAHPTFGRCDPARESILASRQLQSPGDRFLKFGGRPSILLSCTLRLHRRALRWTSENHMTKPSAVCIQCGHFKRVALRACDKCGFLPVTPEDCARSLMLSLCFDVGEEVVGLTPNELQDAAKTIQGGQPFQFNPVVLSEVVALQQTAKTITPRRLVIDLVRWLLPPLAILGGALWLLSRK